MEPDMAQVVLINRLHQSITVGLTVNGRAVDRQLPPRGTLGPVSDGDVPEYTRSLVERGYVRMMAAQT